MAKVKSKTKRKTQLNRLVRSIGKIIEGRDDFFDPAMLGLYKKLCRYYYDIDPVATASYVYAYRDMWDEGGVNLSKPK